MAGFDPETPEEGENGCPPSWTSRPRTLSNGPGYGDVKSDIVKPDVVKSGIVKSGTADAAMLPVLQKYRIRSRTAFVPREWPPRPDTSMATGQGETLHTCSREWAPRPTQDAVPQRL